MRKVLNLVRYEWVRETYRVTWDKGDWEALIEHYKNTNETLNKGVYDQVKNITFDDVVAMYEGTKEFPMITMRCWNGTDTYPETLQWLIEDYMREDAYGSGPEECDSCGESEEEVYVLEVPYYGYDDELVN